MPPAENWPHDVERYLAQLARTGKRPTILFTPHGHTAPGWTPAVDVYETDDSLVVMLDLAGVDPNQVDVQAEAGQLRVRGVRRERHAGAETGGQRPVYHALEIPYGRFERALPLPPGIDTAQARASYRDGLLKITLPKRAPTQVKIAVDGE